MFEECLKNAFPDYPLSFYFYAGEGVGVAVTLVEDNSFDAVISVTFLLYFSSSPSSITLLIAFSMSSIVISLRDLWVIFSKERIPKNRISLYKSCVVAYPRIGRSSAQMSICFLKILLCR